MKKNIAFLLALMLLLSLCLTGCGGKNELAAEENDPAVSESEGNAITIDDKGLASWKPVEGVRIYHINALMEKRVLHGSDFGYRIEILSIENDANGEPTATIRITR